MDYLFPATGAKTVADLTFAADGTELAAGDGAKLFGKKRVTREPVVGTATVA
ncbi:MAG: hypothetical protein ABEH78_04535 [Haloferacaceae archaeon]